MAPPTLVLLDADIGEFVSILHGGTHKSGKGTDRMEGMDKGKLRTTVRRRTGFNKFTLTPFTEKTLAG